MGGREREQQCVYTSERPKVVSAEVSAEISAEISVSVSVSAMATETERMNFENFAKFREFIP